MNTSRELRSNRVSRDTVAKILCVTAAVGSGYLIGLKATTVVVGATAAPGALSTTTAVIGGKTMVLSTVAAGIGMQILIGTCAGLLIGGISYAIYNKVTKKETEVTPA